MSMKNGPVCKARTVNHVAISVSDLARSRDWYLQTFGLRLIQESAESVLLGFGESMLVLRAEGSLGPSRISCSESMITTRISFALSSSQQAWTHRRIPTASMFAIRTA